MLLHLRFVFPGTASPIRCFGIVYLYPRNGKKPMWDIFAEVPALQNGKTDLGAERTSAAQLIPLYASEEQAL